MEMSLAGAVVLARGSTPWIPDLYPHNLVIGYIKCKAWMPIVNSGYVIAGRLSYKMGNPTISMTWILSIMDKSMHLISTFRNIILDEG